MPRVSRTRNAFASFAFAPVGLIVATCYLYALWADLKTAGFARFALDFVFFPAGIVHGVWLLGTRLL